MAASRTSSATTSSSARLAIARAHRGGVVAQLVDRCGRGRNGGSTACRRRRSSPWPCSGPSSTPSIGSASVSPSKRSGSSSTSATVHAGQIRIVERQLDIRPAAGRSHCFSSTAARRRLGHAGARDQLPPSGSAIHAARLAAHSRAPALACSCACSWSNRCCSTMLSGGHAANVSSTSPATTVGRRLPHPDAAAARAPAALRTPAAPPRRPCGR